MDDVLCKFTEAHQASLIKNPEIKYPQSIKGFFENLKPIENAIESVQQLRKIFDVYILTAPSTMNPLCYTEKRIWIEKHFGYEFTNKLIISPNKGLLKGDVLIDDNNTGKGQDEFEGRFIHFGKEDFPNWDAVILALSSENI